MPTLPPIKTEYRRDLPHIQPVGETFFVTYRLKSTLPWVVVEQLRREKEARYRLIRETGDPSTIERLNQAQKREFVKYDAYLDRCTFGERHLERPELAGLVAQSLHFWDGRHYELITYTIMPNHVHAVLGLWTQLGSSSVLSGRPEGYRQLYQVLKSIKNFSARQCNEFLNRQGAFWQKESYDHLVRNSNELTRIITYVLSNPVKAGLVADWKDWPFTYLRPDYSEN